MINLDKQFSIISEKFNLIENSLNNMNNIDSNELIKLNREYSELKPIVEKIQEYNNFQKDIIPVLQGRWNWRWGGAGEPFALPEFYILSNDESIVLFIFRGSCIF